MTPTAPGVRYELIDGMYLLTPPPALLHQIAQLCPALQPDVMVATRDDPGPDALCMPLLLAVEVTSPETQTVDLRLKRAIYEESGISSYWLFDPAQEVLTVLELVDGRYVERAVVKGDDAFEAEVPFPVRISPAGLLHGRL